MTMTRISTSSSSNSKRPLYILIAHGFLTLLLLSVLVILYQGLNLTYTSTKNDQYRNDLLLHLSSSKTSSSSSLSSQKIVVGGADEGQQKQNNGWNPVYVFHGIIDKEDDDIIVNAKQNEQQQQQQQNQQNHKRQQQRNPIDVLPNHSLTFQSNWNVYGSQVNQDIIVIALMSRYISYQEDKQQTMTKYHHNYLRHNNYNNNDEYLFYFIDLAANDAIQLSNTLKLETMPTDIQNKWDPKHKQNWYGLCIEPNSKYWLRLAHRKCTVIGSYVGVSLPKHDGMFMNVTSENEEAYTGIVGNDMDNNIKRIEKYNTLTEQRAVISFTTILNQFYIPDTKYIDYLSLDVEGAEYIVMKHFPYDKYIIRIITIERPKDELKHLLQRNGYIFVMLLASWGEELWVHKSFILSSTNTDDQTTNDNYYNKRRKFNSNTDESCGMNFKQVQMLVQSLSKTAILE